jgi:hypothetical protein
VYRAYAIQSPPKPRPTVVMRTKRTTTTKTRKAKKARSATTGVMRKKSARASYGKAAKKTMANRRAPMVETLKREAQDLAQVNARRFTSPGSTLHPLPRLGPMQPQPRPPLPRRLDDGERRDR